jgi:molecular chaperone GrpE
MQSDTKNNINENDVSLNKKEDVLENESSLGKGSLEEPSLEENNNSQEEEYLNKISFLEDQLKLSLADFSNYKKRMAKEQDNFLFLETSKIILDFLSFKETLLKAIEHEENLSSKNNLIEINNNYDLILSRLNIKKIDLLGLDYDYNTAECVQTLKVDKKEKHNKILDVLENAYTYKDKIIKPGKVIIGLFSEE